MLTFLQGGSTHIPAVGQDEQNQGGVAHTAAQTAPPVHKPALPNQTLRNVKSCQPTKATLKVHKSNAKAVKSPMHGGLTTL